jgi:hypothetical protein
MRIEELLDVPVTQTLEEELSATNGFQQDHIGFAEGLQRAASPFLPPYRSLDVLQQLFQRLAAID